MTPRPCSRPRPRPHTRGLVAVSATVVVLTALLVTGPGRAPRARAADDPPKKAAPAAPPKAGALPSLEVDHDEPLLLDKPAPADTKAPTHPTADNSACHVCHTNFRKEPLATSHADHGVGCVRCHGASEAHRNDENNITPPDTMFPLAKIDDACRSCHKRHNVPARAVVARFLERKTTTALDRLVCTECHGAHRLARRSVVWDRATGKLQSAAPVAPK